MNPKFFFLNLFLVLSLVSSCNRSENTYTELLNKEIQDSNSFLQSEIILQDSHIEFKVGDYPYKKPSYDSLNRVKVKVDSFSKKNNFHQQDSNLIKKFKIQIEKESGQSFDFNCLMIKTKVKDSIFSKIAKLDLLKVKYVLNKRFIIEKCNIVE